MALRVRNGGPNGQPSSGRPSSSRLSAYSHSGNKKTRTPLSKPKVLDFRIMSWRMGAYRGDNHSHVSTQPPDDTTSRGMLVPPPHRIKSKIPHTDTKILANLSVARGEQRRLLIGNHKRKTEENENYLPATQILESLDHGYPSTILGWGLDSFYLGLNAYDRMLMQYYWIEMPTIAYGLRPNGLFNPIRSVNYPGSTLQPSLLRWTLIIAETYMTRRQGRASPVTLLKRRADAYGSLQAALSDPEECCSDKTVINVGSAIVTEYRCGVDPELSRMHLKGMEQLRQMRKRKNMPPNNLQALQRSLYHAMYTTCELEVATQAEFDDMQTTCLKTLEALQTWFQGFRTSLFCESPPSRLLDHLRARVNTLCSPVILPLLELPTHYENYSHHAGHFANLFSLNLSLWELGPDCSTRFFQRLLTLVEGSAATDPETGKSLFKGEAWLYLLREVRLDVKPFAGLDWEGGSTAAVIDGLKFFSYLDEKGRQRLITVLSSWVLDGWDQENGSDFFSDKDIVAFRDALASKSTEQLKRKTEERASAAGS